MSIIKTIFHKIKIHKSCYLFFTLAILLGQFHIIFFCSLLLFIHECGHFFTAVFFHWKTDSISFYPFGGISYFANDINCPLKEELLVLLMGPITQCIFYFLFRLFPFSHYQFLLLKSIHYSLLFFNLLPIYPFDGGRILQVLSCSFLSYQNSYQFILFVSYIFLFFILVLFFYAPSLSFFFLLLIVFLRFQKEKKQIDYNKEKFLLERYLHNYSYKKTKIVQHEKQFKRSYTHIIQSFPWYQTEKKYLIKKYEKK